MSKKPTPEEFAERLEENEAMMSEHAAFAVTCDQFGIEIMDGYDLLVELAVEHGE